MLCSSCWVAPGRSQVGVNLSMHHPGNHIACAPTGQLQTMLEYHHTAPAQLIHHGGQRLVVSGHSPSLQLTGLCKSLLFNCQQQSRLNYKRRVYSAPTEGTSPVASLGDRRGCATGSSWTSTTLGHTTKTGGHSSST